MKSYNTQNATVSLDSILVEHITILKKKIEIAYSQE
jgi:hypothetical protein